MFKDLSKLSSLSSASVDLIQEALQAEQRSAERALNAEAKASGGVRDYDGAAYKRYSRACADNLAFAQSVRGY